MLVFFLVYQVCVLWIFSQVVGCSHFLNGVLWVLNCVLLKLIKKFFYGSWFLHPKKSLPLQICRDFFFFTMFPSRKFSSCSFNFSVQFSSVAESCPTLCNPVNRSMPGLTVHHQLLESTQTHVHWVSDAIPPSHPLSSPSPPTFNLSQHQGLFKWVSSLHQVA